jgi:hypothetical protein
MGSLPTSRAADLPSAVDPPSGERAGAGAASLAKSRKHDDRRWRPRWRSARLAWVVGGREGSPPPPRARAPLPEAF